MKNKSALLITQNSTQAHILACALNTHNCSHTHLNYDAIYEHKYFKPFNFAFLIHPNAGKKDEDHVITWVEKLGISKECILFSIQEPLLEENVFIFYKLLLYYQDNLFQNQTRFKLFV